MSWSADEVGVVEGLARQVAADAAGPAADAVDREARFPSESLTAMRESKLLSTMVPVEYGGLGADLVDVARAVRTLATECASTALVFAMHQIEVAYLARHGHTPGLRGLLEEVVRDQLLLANANSEVGVGGDVGTSLCAIERLGNGRYRLEKHALAISYGAYADAILTTARVSPESAGTDQAFVVCRPPGLSLQATSEWDTTGLRGTCSNSFRLVAEGPEDLIFPEPFSEIAGRTGIPVTQVLLSAVWWGLAEAAAKKAHDYVRAKERGGEGTLTAAGLRLSELSVRLQGLRELVTGGARHYEERKDDPSILDWGFGVLLRNLKVASSESSVDIVTRALQICGIAGFSRKSPFSLDRVLRDAHGGPIMVNNDRYHEVNAYVLRALREL